jgi:elongation factor Ts
VRIGAGCSILFLLAKLADKIGMLDKIKKLREQTGAGVVEIKKALSEAGGDEEKVSGILRKSIREKAMKKSGRAAREGVITSYIHSNKKVGTIVKLCCETDFVAKNKEFEELARDIAMHITAMNPKFICPEDVSSELVEKEKEIWKEQLEKERKPKEIFEKILEGKEKKFRQEISLLSQAYVKNPDITVEQLIAEKIAKIGENIRIEDFSRLEL